MTPDFKRLVDISYALQEKSITGRCYHVSFILNKSKILSIGLNDYKKTHPKTKEFGYHPNSKLHSELAACLRLGLTDCEGLTIVNVRINNNGLLDNSKFCAGCSNLIKSLKFNSAYFSNERGEFQQY